jgi:AraC-like DNA-binding protein
MAKRSVRKREAGSSGRFETATGNITRLACARLQAAGITWQPLVAKAGLTSRQIEDPTARISVRHQIKFLNLAASVLKDERLGFHLAVTCDLRMIGLLYYVAASAQTLGEALRRVARYASTRNEVLYVRYSEGKDDLRISIDYVGVPRHTDRHQIEFCLTVLIRLCRHLTGRHLVPRRVRIAHRGDRVISKRAAFVGGDIEFNAKVDEVVFDIAARDMPVLSADTYLNGVLVAFAEEAIARLSGTRGNFEVKVENAIAPLLPHGRVAVAEIAHRLGMSQRTFARKLAAEGLTFTELLDRLRKQLARQYLSDPALQISEIAWLLGYREVSAFTHAFRRWTGNTPREARSHREFPATGSADGPSLSQLGKYF